MSTNRQTAQNNKLASSAQISKGRRPIVAIPCDIKMMGPHPFHSVGEKYIHAINQGSQCLPWLVPSLPTPIELDEIFEQSDGIFLTGSWSNVHPKHYDGPEARDGVLLDEQRDNLALPLIREAVARSVPLFAVCRGFQEMNVAYGGSLHQHIHEVPSEPGYAPRFDHREDKDAPLEVQYGPAHPVTLKEDGILATLTGTTEIEVNSLHGQGVDRVGTGLSIDARALDGTVEALHVEAATNFAYAVQWHPEWKFWENPTSKKLFQAFGDAVRTAAHSA